MDTKNQLQSQSNLPNRPHISLHSALKGPFSIRSKTSRVQFEMGLVPFLTWARVNTKQTSRANCQWIHPQWKNCLFLSSAAFCFWCASFFHFLYSSKYKDTTKAENRLCCDSCQKGKEKRTQKKHSPQHKIQGHAETTSSFQTRIRRFILWETRLPEHSSSI